MFIKQVFIYQSSFSQLHGCYGPWFIFMGWKFPPFLQSVWIDTPFFHQKLLDNLWSLWRNVVQGSSLLVYLPIAPRIWRVVILLWLRNLVWYFSVPSSQPGRRGFFLSHSLALIKEKKAQLLSAHLQRNLQIPKSKFLFKNTHTNL